MNRRASIRDEWEHLQVVRKDTRKLAAQRPVPEPELAQAEHAAATLRRWGVHPYVCAAALLVPLLRHACSTRTALARQFGTRAVALARRLVLWQSASPQPTEFLSKAQRVLELRKLMREVHLDRPRLPLVLLLMAYHEAHLQSMKVSEQQPPSAPLIQTAEATKSIWVPLAEMLGMWHVGSRWLDFASRILNPRLSNELAESMVRARDLRAIKHGAGDWLTAAQRSRRQRARICRSFVTELQALLDSCRLKARVQLKPNRPGSAIRRLEEGESLAEVTSRLGVKVFCRSEHECYTALGLVHQLGRRLAPRFSQQFDDYIAAPQASGYRAIHTTIEYLFYSSKLLVEVRILTSEMNRVNLHGVLRTPRKTRRSPVSGLEWLTAKLPDWVRTQALGTSTEDIYVFTPRGQIVLLKNAAILDFAYSIHSNLGNSLSAVEVNGETVPLGWPLKNGDLIHIRTSPGAPGPDTTWLHLAMWESTRAKIRRALRLRSEQTHPGQAVIQELVLRIIDYYWMVKGYDLNIPTRRLEELLSHIARLEGLPNVTALYAKVEEQKSRAVLVVQQIISLHLVSRLVTPDGETPPYNPERILLCHSCWPAPGEPLVAHGHKKDYAKLIVHTSECPLNAPPDRRVPITWGEQLEDLLAIRILGEDRSGLLEDVLQCVYQTHGTSLQQVAAKGHDDGHADITLTVLLQDPTRRLDLQRRLEAVPQTRSVLIQIAEQSRPHRSAPAPKGIPFTEAVAQNRLDFFDRNEPLAVLNQWLEEPPELTRLLLIRGQRRVGKTSLLLYWRQQLLTEARHRVLPVYVTLQSLTTTSPAGVARLLAEAVFSALKQPVPPQHETEEPFVWLNRCLEAAIGHLAPVRLLLMLDEFAALQEWWEKEQLPEQVFGNLRFLFSERRDMNWLLVVQEEYFHWLAGPARDLFKLATDYRLPEMGPFWADKMVQDYARRLGITIDDTVRTRLLELTGGNPYLIKRLCMDMYLRHRQDEQSRIRLAADDLDFAVSLLLHRAENDLDHYLRYLRPVAVALLHALAAQWHDEWADLSPAQRAVEQQGYTPELVRVALEDLVRLGLVETRKTNSDVQVRFLVGLIREWAKPAGVRRIGH